MAVWLKAFIYEVINEGHANTVIASIAHYGKCTIKQMKEYLAKRGITEKLYNFSL